METQSLLAGGPRLQGQVSWFLQAAPGDGELALWGGEGQRLNGGGKSTPRTLLYGQHMLAVDGGFVLIGSVQT